MIGHKSKFTSFEEHKKGHVTFDDNVKCKILSMGSVGSSYMIKNVFLADGLKYDFLSISQLCDQGHSVIFKSLYCMIVRCSDENVIFVGHRMDNICITDVYDLSKYGVMCFSVIINSS